MKKTIIFYTILISVTLLFLSEAWLQIRYFKAAYLAKLEAKAESPIYITKDLKTGTIIKDCFVNSRFLPYELKPNSDMLITVSKYGRTWASYRIVTNDLGHRTMPGISQTPSKKDILIVGDSVAFGYRLNYEDTINYKLQEELEKKYNKPLTVQNLSLNGNGPVEYLALLKHYYKYYKSKYVIVIFYTGNDYSDSIYSMKQRYFSNTFDDNAPISPHRSNDIVFDVTTGQWGLQKQKRNIFNLLITPRLLASKFAVKHENLQLLEILSKTMIAMKDFAATNNFTLLFVISPPENISIPENNIFYDVARKLDIPVIHLNDMYRNISSPKERLTMDDAHYTAEGSGFVAKFIALNLSKYFDNFKNKQ